MDNGVADKIEETPGPFLIDSVERESYNRPKIAWEAVRANLTWMGGDTGEGSTIGEETGNELTWKGKEVNNV